MSLLQDNINNISKVELDKIVKRKLLDFGFLYDYKFMDLFNELILVNELDFPIGFSSTTIVYKNGVISLMYPMGKSERVKIDDIDDLNLAICRGFDKMRKFAKQFCRNQTDVNRVVWKYAK